MMHRITITDQQQHLMVDHERLQAAVAWVLAAERVPWAEVGVALVDDALIHALNRRHLDHDTPTDVIAFPLERTAERLEGEIVVSAQTARDRAAEYGWKGEDELLLYVVHGTLHLVGYDDRAADDRDRMRGRERECLAHFGLVARYDEEAPAASPPRPSRGGTKGT